VVLPMQRSARSVSWAVVLMQWDSGATKVRKRVGQERERVIQVRGFGSIRRRSFSELEGRLSSHKALLDSSA
jgi:hypothetical protein